jgi:hypothetical protein
MRASIADVLGAASNHRGAVRATSRRPKLREQVGEALRLRHYSRRTEQADCFRRKRSIFFHHRRHPAETAKREIDAFLTHLAVDKVRALAQSQAFSALLFPHRYVLVRSVTSVKAIHKEHLAAVGGRPPAALD